MQVVDEESASPTVQDVERAGIQADHSHMCKFESENAPGFDLVAEAIQRYAEEAPDWIKGRWAAEVKERVIQKEAAAEELLPGKCPIVSPRPRSSLTGIGSVKRHTPHSESSSTFEPSPGKTVKALPAPHQQKSFLESEYTVEFEDDNVRVAR